MMKNLTVRIMILIVKYTDGYFLGCDTDSDDLDEAVIQILKIFFTTRL